MIEITYKLVWHMCQLFPAFHLSFHNIHFKDNNNQNQGVNKDSQNQKTFTSIVINNK